ncbi:hypothetical protein MMC09_004659 [Bachmanniomyces sp. S44760]|nr:hypothetical protein [Bachmanniomyces sp. S44760]
MPRRKVFDKATSTTYALVHRPQTDPKIHDNDENGTSSMVFAQLAPPQAHKIKTRRDLEEELFREDGGGGNAGAHVGGIRENEGEAAEYGIYFDDSGYDYMQHMRDLGGQGGEGGTVSGVFMEAEGQEPGKGKEKISLEDALRRIELDQESIPSQFNGEARSGDGLLDEEILPSKFLNKITYQDQQNVPDSLAGLQPDMNSRLREVLEALEDEAYVDDEDEVFGKLAEDGREVSLAEFEQLGVVDEEDFVDEDDAGWETDDTAKPDTKYRSRKNQESKGPISGGIPTSVDLEDHGDGDWMKEFSKFKKADKATKQDKDKGVTPSNADVQSSIMTGISSMAGTRKKKRKGAMTSSTGYSMTSSSMYRTEGQTLLDARFDKIEEDYAEDEIGDGMDDDETGSIMTGTASVASSQAPSLVSRSDFDDIMDDFLGGYSMSGKKRLKKGKYQNGMEQLDEIRRELKNPRLSTQKA